MIRLGVNNPSMNYLFEIPLFTFSNFCEVKFEEFPQNRAMHVIPQNTQFTTKLSILFKPVLLHVPAPSDAKSHVETRLSD